MIPEEMKRIIDDNVITKGPAGTFFNPDNLRAVPLPKGSVPEGYIYSHVPGTDINLGARYIIHQNGTGMMSYAVKQDHMAGFRMTESEIMQRALMNSRTMDSIEITSLWEKLGIPFGLQEESDLYVISNPECMYGAAAIAMPDVMQAIHDKFQSNFFVLPSSIHEILACKDNGSMDAKDLQAIVHMVNSTEVADEDQLSDCVFYYDGNSLSLAAGEMVEENEIMSVAMDAVNEVSDTMENVPGMHM